jgi:hypothetical protein
MTRGPRNTFLTVAAVLIALTCMASNCHKIPTGVDERCATLFTHETKSQTQVGGELSLKGYDLGKAKIDANQANSLQIEIDDILNEHNQMSANLCNMWANEVISKEVYATTQFCYDNNQRKLRGLVLGLKSGVVEAASFHQELLTLNQEYDKCTPQISSTAQTSAPPPPAGGASNVQGTPCQADSGCVAPLYCIVGQCRPLGEIGGPCALDIDCKLPYICQSGSCSAGSSTVFGSACTSDANCQAPLFCILSTCRYLGNNGDPCGQTIDCYSPLVCSNGACQYTTPTTPTGTTAGKSTVYGTPCNSDNDCQSPLFCIKKICRYLGNPGDGCDYDYDCYSPYVCSNGVCGTGIGGGTAGGSVGGSVSGSASTVWSATVSGYVSIGGGGGGAKSCTADDQCVKPDYCIVGYCRPLQPDGGECKWNNDCKNGTCTNGACGTGGVGGGGSSANKPCGKNDDCPLYNICISGTCTPSKTGDACLSDNDCMPPNYCIVGQCRPLQGVGGVCNINADCQSGLYCKNYTCSY